MNRLKFEISNPESYRCCFCCHVRTGTLIIGLFYLLAQLACIGLLLFLSINPDVLAPKPDSHMMTDSIVVTENDDGYFIDTYSVFTRKQFTKEDMCVAYGLTFAAILITASLIYGVIRTKPRYLLPFFCLQVFDFCLKCITVVGFFTYAPNIKLWIEQQGLANLPGWNMLMKMDSNWLMLGFVTFFVFVLCIKAYLIGVVWACNKYLHLKLANRSVVREYTVDPDSEMLLPPKYEDAIKMNVPVKMDGPAPPPYAP
ncbi:hypothetical protein LOTGIDRAFT_150683 [Lottia gigantea]|uniref:Lysosomal-associated transmembrane protein 4A n=1 Tax=Lottia gigantea TaxID=225164 RepID=V4BHK9_LOTGI|nr:hypothetical protein LOTGIDRAFT_150683 [Lottia gigantea]ESO88279.1 hypothetical protein LOTGIDRAFT_150683 [Lottia gigantea]